jgi:hypothetical protein
MMVVVLEAVVELLNEAMKAVVDICVLVEMEEK